MGKARNLMGTGGRKKDSEHLSKIDLINNTTTRPHITVSGYGISDSGSIIHCYGKDTPMKNYILAAAFHTVKPDGSIHLKQGGL